MAFILRFAGLRLGKNACDTASRFLSLSPIRSGTIVPYKLSDIGEGIRDVTVKEWYGKNKFVKPGDRVSQFDNICEVQSDKASVTITSRYDGLIKTLHYKVDDVALVGDPLVDIELDDNVKTEEESVEKKGEQKKAENVAETFNTEKEVSKNTFSDKVLATPAVRRIAMENNINLKTVPATGRDGRILKEDVLVYLGKITKDTKQEKEKDLQEIDHKPLTGKIIPVKRYSKHMWRTMTQSLSIPHFVYSDECDVSELIKHRNEVKDTLKEQGISLSLMPFLVKAASRALEKVPELNAWLDEENQGIRLLDGHNIGIAMDTPEGLVVPNIKNVQNLNIIEIAKELNRLQELGKKAAIPLNDLTNTTFSLSNIGVIGGTYTKPVIQPPQVVIGAFGKIQKLPRFDEEGKIFAANIISVSWAADHRVIDGVTMARYSNIWRYYIENPTYLLIGA